MSQDNKNEAGDSSIIKNIAITQGFSYCGIAEAVDLDTESIFLDKWLKNSYHSGLSYMERNKSKRIDPRLLFEGARSLIVLAMNYYPGETFQQNTKYRVAHYALGDDYHSVLKVRSEKLISELQEKHAGFSYRSFIDSAPLMEKAWAARAGLGRIGKNGLLIIPGAGSYFSLCIIITDMPLEYDEPFNRDLCGTCSKCLNACPVSAIAEPGFIDAAKCISALTIEGKHDFSDTGKYKLHNRIFGCDICQKVCPWNKHSKVTEETGFTPYPFFKEVTDEQWENMTEEEFNKLFSKSPLKRMAYNGIMRNIRLNKI
jgi:epoxyqueuosine reductase